MSVSVTISGEIIESQTYLSNYFVTITGDQTIYGNKIFNSVDISSINFNSGNIEANTLDISSNILSFNGNTGTQNQILTSNGSYPVWKDLQEVQGFLFGTQTIDPDVTSGTINFNKTFDLLPYVTISQQSSSRVVPICITNVSLDSFSWAGTSNNIGNIMWSAGLQFNN